MAYYVVESFHINIDAGDGAIHILTSGPTLGSNRKRKVHRAVFIDGGKCVDKLYRPNITFTIQDIETNYVCQGPEDGPNGRRRLMFDAFVVTHWDEDHCDGLMKFLSSNVNSKDNRLSRVNYGANGAESYFFCPVFKKNAGGIYHTAHNEDFDSDADETSLHIRTIGKLWARNVLKLRVGIVPLLGRNFFNLAEINIQLPFTQNQSTDDLDSVKKLVNFNPPVQENGVTYTIKPGLYCVAVRQRTMGLNPALVQNYTEKNKSSICCMIIWDDNDNRCSHYFAGDADQKLEQRILDWTNPGTTERQVTSMKLSHHGAWTSTPLNMLNRWDPKNLIVSAGGGSYGHPRWELLVYVHSWFRLKMKSIGQHAMPARPLFFTQWPRYMFENKPGDFNLTSRWSVKELDDMRGIIKTVTTQVNQKRRERGMRPITTFFDRFDDQHKTIPSEKLIKKFILQYFKKSLGSVSGISPLSIGMSGKAFQTALKQAVRVSNMNVYVNVISAPNSNDGKVIVRHGNKYQSFYNERTFNIKLQQYDALFDENPTAVDIIGFDDLQDGVSAKENMSDLDLWDLFDEDDSSDTEHNASWLDIDEFGIFRNETRVTVVRVDPSGPLHLVSSGLKNQPTTGTIIKVDEGHPLFNFINRLHWRLLSLEQAPIPATPISISPDTWTSWFNQIFDTLDCRLKLTTSSSGFEAASIVDFSTTVKFAGKETNMRTSDAKDRFPEANLQRMRTEAGCLLFGLASETTAFEVSLGEVAEFVGISRDNYKALKFLEKISLKLDTQGLLKNGKTRNGLWFKPNNNYETVIRLQFTVPLIDVLTSWLNGSDQGEINGVKGLEVIDFYVIARRTATCELGASEDIARSTGELAFILNVKIGEIPFQASLEIEPDSISLRLQKNDIKGDTLESLLGWLGNKLKLEGLELRNWLKKSDGKNVLDAVSFRRLTLSITVDEETGQLKSVSQLTISLQITLKIGKAEGKEAKPLVFLCDFGWDKTTGCYLKGNIWALPPEYNGDDYQMALPGWEEYLVFEPIVDDANNRAQYLDLKSLMPGNDKVSNIPSGIPTIITKAEIELDEKGIRFAGTIECEKPKEANNVPGFVLEDVSLSAGYSWDELAKGFSASLEVDVLLFPGGKIDEKVDIGLQDVARLMGVVTYEKGSWTLQARVQDLSVAHIASFWIEGPTRDNVLEYLGKYKIDYLDLTYEYAAMKDGVAKKFEFNGLLTMGNIKLGLKYTNSKNYWIFLARLGTKLEEAATVGEVLKGLDVDLSVLPSAVTAIKLVDPDGADDIMGLTCYEVGKLFVLNVFIHLKHISFTFTQLRGQDWDKDRPPKRYIKATISEIGPVKVPFIDELKQPFDQMYYMWVQDNNTKAAMDQRGITEAEVKTINSIEGLKIEDHLFFKKTKPNTKENPTVKVVADDEKKNGDAVICTGSHFFIVVKDKKEASEVILDYIFNKPKPTSTKDLVSFGGSEAENGEKNGSAPFKKAIGPLSVESIGLRYEDGRLGIILDATFLMGPVGLMLLGFGVDVPFDSKYNFSNPPSPSQIKPLLSGILVSFDKPPLTVAGGFKYSEMHGMKAYAGGLVVQFQPWMIQAAGIYAEVPKGWRLGAITNADGEPKETYASVFIFFKLQGPLFSVGFADVSGLTGGFGVNSDIVLPTVDQVVSFPFVAPSGTGADDDTPLKTLSNLLNGVWFRPSEGTFWVAAGVKVTAFQMLAVDAVIVVAFNPTVKLGLFGVATADIPSSLSKVKFTHIELGIVCTLDVEAGVFKVEAQLSPRSFILHPSCHLTGGFALYSWFKDGESAIAGDWVMSIGGYHQAFVVPAHYPRPSRLRISWSLDSSISVTGEAYFAITPKVCMGGGRLHAALTLGALYAYFDAYLDFLINYQQFHFQGEAKISVGIKFTMDMWIVTIHISAEISAILTVSGPPFGGIVHVDFWVFGFEIGFGASAEKPRALDLKQFWDMVLKPSNSSPKALISAQEGPDVAEELKAHLFTCESGLVPAELEENKKTKDGSTNSKPWLVRGGDFSFLVAFQFAITEGTLKETVGNVPSKTQTLEGFENYKGAFARPMQLTTAMTSNATVEISQAKANARPLRHGYGALLAEGKERRWRVKPAIKAVQQSIWGQYNENSDPSVTGNHADELLRGDKVSLPLVMGLSISPPVPEMSDDKISKFNIVEDMKDSVNKDDKPENKDFPREEKASEQWNPRASSEKLEVLREQWKSESSDPMAVVTSWASRLGFDTQKISGARPEMFIHDMEHYIAATPLISLAATA